MFCFLVFFFFQKKYSQILQWKSIFMMKSYFVTSSHFIC